MRGVGRGRGWGSGVRERGDLLAPNVYSHEKKIMIVLCFAVDPPPKTSTQHYHTDMLKQ